MNLYYDPQDYSLEPVGEIDWSDGNYVFNLTVVWRRTSDGRLVYGEDSGCSCPSPFEDQGVEDLKPITSVSEFQDLLDKRAEDSPYRDMDVPASEYKAMERANLIAKLVGR